jgi:hypothetical protein
MNIDQVRWLREVAVIGHEQNAGRYPTGLAAWARSGFNVLNISADIAAQLVCTEPSPELFICPFECVIVMLPPAVFPTWNAVTLHDTYFDYEDPDYANHGIAVTVNPVAGHHPDARMPGVARRGGMYGTPSEIALATGDGLMPEGEQLLAVQVAAAYARSWAAFRESSERSTVKYTVMNRQRREVTVWRLFKNVRLTKSSPTAKAARSIVLGRTPPGLHMVRGHWKRISSKLSWVMPYLRGRGEQADAKIYQ